MSDNDLTDGLALAAFETLREFLEEDGWFPQQLTDAYALRMGFSGAHGQTTCFARIDVELQLFLFYVVAPVKAPEPVRDAVAQYATRANYGLRIGNLEMDYRDGEIRFKSALDFEDNDLTPSLIRNAIYPAVQTMDRYLPGVMAVIYGGQAPADAIAEIEGEVL
ncbi:MAG TPA: YbjN domain-containing protein [Anaerolineae bacterium]|nr:YbjN domain-containing protein [Anaerolineae bacterium]